MQNAPFSGASLTDFLDQLADGVAGGCLHVDSGAQASKIFFRGGQVYAILVPGPVLDVGARLITAGALSPQTLAEVTEARRTTFPTWSIVDLLVHHGHVEQSSVDAIVREQICQSLADLLRSAPTAWRFRVNERTRDNVAPSMTVADLLADLGRRQVVWQTIEAAVGGPDAVPFASPGAVAPDDLELHPGARTLLGHVNGARSVSELAELCAFTEFEAGQVVFALVQAQLLTIPRHDAALLPIESSVGIDRAATGEAGGGPLTRAFHALAALLGPAPTGEDLLAVPVRTKRSATVGAAKRRAEALAAEALAAEALAAEALAAEVLAAETAAEQGRLEALERARVAAELLSAQLAADAAAEQQVEADRLSAQQAEAARLAEVARVAEAARLAAEAAEVTRVAAEQAEQAEAERLAAERAEVARVAEAVRLAAEVARVTAEQAEAERLAAERAEVARVAAEQAEATRVAEAVRLAAEVARVTAEQAEAERLAAERAEVTRVAEAARLAAEAAEEMRGAQRALEQAEAQRQAADLATAQAAERAVAQAAAAVSLAAQVAADAQAAEQARAQATEQVDPDLHAAAFAELRAAATTPAILATSSRADPAPTSAPIAPTLEPLALPPEPYRSSDTDTASLLRELSSLGLDDDEEPAPRPNPPTRSVPRAAAEDKKRKGRFGRN